MGLLAKLRHFVPKQILLEIYLSPTQPYIKYGIAAWGQASKTHLNKILLLLKSSSENKLLGRRDHAISLFIHANVLPSNFLYFIRLYPIFMHDDINVPSSILNLFQQTRSSHSYNTRASALGNLLSKNSSELKLYRLSFSRFGAKL